jgi:hypothetical protein
MKLAAALILLPLASFAAGDAPCPAVTEGPFVEWVQVVDTFGPVDLMGVRALPDDVLLRRVFNGHRIAVAPVPLPKSYWLLVAAIAAFAAVANVKLPRLRL